ncbi:hypothetical protein PHMEG_00017714 [Phytophthora megakarya]|uniref:Uncharacterized protein n=1 Tax=Phytophthora megakarya TaxID=4795 RepID=A0A225VW45_9STRA|nr:hypothetical protein PHMEG_00017714 [Phytophthora megakarya]
MGKQRAPDGSAPTKLCERCDKEFSRSYFSKHTCNKRHKPRKVAQTRKTINQKWWAKHYDAAVAKQRQKRGTKIYNKLASKCS